MESWSLTCILFTICSAFSAALAGDLVGCGGFIQSDIPVNFSQVEVVLYTKDGIQKYRTDCAPNNGYFLIPLYDMGEFVLRVEPPTGWKFLPASVDLNVDGENDVCSRGEDINFVFAGFALSGRVVSRGEKEGPLGVSIAVRKVGSDTVVTTVTSGAGGAYIIPGLMPGHYVLTASHEQWKLSKTSTTVELKVQNTEVPEQLVVDGYDAQGRVESDGNPTPGVSFLLYGSPKVELDCPKVAKPNVEVSDISGKLLCEVTSGKDGRFKFDSLPLGDYNILPYYRDEHIMFDVLPRKLPISVAHGSVQLTDVFRVHGFTVSGRVLNKQNGAGIAGAVVSAKGLDGTTVTDEKGQYFLQHVRAGVYHITVATKGYFFEPEDVTISASAPQLPDIAASEFSLCGKVSVTSSSKSPTPLAKRQIKLIATGTEGKGQLATCDKDGSFCFRVAPGKWDLSSVVTDADKKAGFLLHPATHVVSMVDTPRSDVVFSQFFATVSAKVECMATDCTGLPIALQSVSRQDQKRTVLNAEQVDEESLMARVSFKNVLPGQYRMSILYDKWCWKETSIDVQVGSEDVKPVVFKQVGHLLKCLSSHGLTLRYRLTDDADDTAGNGKDAEANEPVQGQAALAEGSGQICLPRPGIYQLTTKSCHRFAGEPFTYNTASPGVVSLTAVAHSVSGSIISTDGSSGMFVSVSVKSSDKKKAAAVTNLGPLDATHAKAEDGTAQFVYHYTHWAKSGEVLSITPALEDMLFDPPTQSVTVPRNACPERIPAFRGRRGVYIAGSVTPAVQDVEITVKFVANNETVRLVTNKSGKYRHGPVDSDRKYTVQAFIDGYVIEQDKDVPTNFLLSKLGEIQISISSGDGALPIPGVLVSLSGGKFRSNNFTNEKGELRILNLAPGQYYLRSMLKEYAFEPASKLIDVSEGGTVAVSISAQRMAFSCFGVARSLGGAPETGITVTAQGLGSCSTSRESAVSGENGVFRLRGLTPSCQYSVAVGDNGSGGRIRAIPAHRTISVGKDDVVGADIVVFQPQSQVQLSGYVKLNQTELLSTLKVVLFAEPHLTSSPVQVISLGDHPFFHFAPLQSPTAPTVYRYLLESSLSKSSYESLTSEVQFTVQPGALHHHGTVEFRPIPVGSNSDAAVKHGSILGVLCVILMSICILNQQRLMALGTSVVHSYLANVNDPSPSRSSRRR